MALSKMSILPLKAQKVAVSWYRVNREFLTRLRKQRAIQKSMSDFSTLPEQVLSGAECCFVLSTGRCGTMLLTEILRRSPTAEVYHTPTPELVYPSRHMYGACPEPKVGRLAVLCSRYELVRDAFIQGRVYVETNNRITFFAPHLRDIFRRAKFVHLVRSPADVVRSGLRRGYFLGYAADEGMIKPRRGSPEDRKWKVMHRIEKIAWVWNETNAFVEEFKQGLSQERVITVLSEALFTKPKTAQDVAEFIGVRPLEEVKLRKLLASPVNRQRGGQHSASYAEWPDLHKEYVRKWATLAGAYGYTL